MSNTTIPYDTYAYDVNRTCLPSCPSGYYADNTTNIKKCWPYPQNCSNFGVSVPSWGDPYLNRCVTLCTSTPVDSYGDNVTSSCVTFCSLGSYATVLAGNRICVSNCSALTYGDPTNRRCIPKCIITPNTWADNSKNLCVSTCTSVTYS